MSLYLFMKETCFVAGDHCRKAQLIKMQRTTDHRVPKPSLYPYSTTHAGKKQESLRKKRNKESARGPGCLL